MCGIAGIWNLNKERISENTASRFLDSMMDRGPDGAGVLFLDNDTLFLGHRRLSILELSDLGKQPMTFETSLHITFNGEIYNFIELRKELENFGYTFKTGSDTEVLLVAYHHWGLDMLQKLNGMFVFALFDSTTRKLILARDRFGVKPLHYSFLNRSLAFASETYAFRFLNGYTREFNPHHLSIAIDNPEVLEGTGHTIFENIFQLLPGHFIIINPDSTSIEQKQWWNTNDNLISVPLRYEEQVEKFREIFSDACKIRLRSDVPIASALSGGMDSSAIYCTLNSLLKESSFDYANKNAQKAFIAWYPGTPNDERAFAEEVIKYTGGDAEYIETNHNDLINELTKTTLRFDAIGGTPVMCATDVYKHMQKAGYKVSIDGHGADEMLFGYKQMVMDAYQTAIQNRNKHEELDLLETYKGLFSEDSGPSAKTYLQHYGNLYRSDSIKGSLKKIIKSFGPNRLPNIYDLKKNEPLKETWLTNRNFAIKSSLSELYRKDHVKGDASNSAYNLFHYTSLPANLRDFDRASMQYGIEIRSPFMDWRLVTYVFSLPLSSKVGNGYTKRILRDAMKGRMPEPIRTRKLKIGLSAPLPSWFNGTLKPYISEIVNSEDFKKQPYWNGSAISEFVNTKEKFGWNDFNECSRIWKFINAYLLISNKTS